MGIESLRPKDATAKELDRTERFARAKEWFDKSVRVASLALMFQSPPGMAMESVGSPTPEEQAMINTTLEKIDAPSTVRLASGNIIHLPTKRDGFQGVTVYEPRGTLPERIVFIFQGNHSHTAEELEGLSPGGKRDMLDAVERSQKHIYDELVRLKKSGVISTACEEGVIGDRGQMENHVRDFKTSPERLIAGAVAPYIPKVGQTLERYDMLTKKTSRTPEENHELQGRINPVLRQIWGKYEHVQGAATAYAIEGGIPLCGAEKQETYDASWQDAIRSISLRPASTWTSEERTEIHQKVYRDRERAALQVAMNSSGSSEVPVISYGTAHDFRTVVAAYDNEHPDHPIAAAMIDAFEAYMPPPTD
jgi:hypothetical protein